MELFGHIHLLILSVLIVLAGSLSRRTRAKYPPGPMALPFIGHLHLINPPLYRAFFKLADRYGPLMYLRFGSAPVVVASSPETVTEIFKSNDVTFANRPMNAATERLSYGRRALPFIPYGPQWAFLKKLISTELLGSDRSDRIRTQELHRFIGDMLEMSRSGRSVDFTWEVLKMSRNTISQMLMGKRLYGDATTAEEIESLVRSVIRVGSEANSSISNVFSFLKHFDVGGHMKRLDGLTRHFDVMLEKIITEREELRKSRRSGEEALDLLDVMLNLMENHESSNSQITKAHIKAILLDTLIAGSESSTVALDWTLAELLKQPEIIKKAQREVAAVVGTSRLVDVSDIKRLTYIQAIIKESLRLHPPIPLMTLKSSQECNISGFTIPSNSTLFINVWGIGRDPKVWDEPLEFWPDRFLEGSKMSKIDVKGRHYQLLSFGTGKRSCPAINSSMHGLTIALAAMVQCFDWKLKGEVVDMSEKVIHAGPGAPRLKPLECFPIVRFTPPNLATFKLV